MRRLSSVPKPDNRNPPLPAFAVPESVASSNLLERPEVRVDSLDLWTNIYVHLHRHSSKTQTQSKNPATATAEDTDEISNSNNSNVNNTKNVSKHNPASRSPNHPTTPFIFPYAATNGRAKTSDLHSDGGSCSTSSLACVYSVGRRAELSRPTTDPRRHANDTLSALVKPERSPRLSLSFLLLDRSLSLLFLLFSCSLLPNTTSC
jgi:hypothetical protein